jgi:hypothetical protein
LCFGSGLFLGIAVKSMILTTSPTVALRDEVARGKDGQVEIGSRYTALSVCISAPYEFSLPKMVVFRIDSIQDEVPY